MTRRPLRVATMKGFWLLLTVPHALSWVIPPASRNVWVTLARTLKQDSMCLSMESPYNPLSTCLVGLPMDEWPVTVDAIHRRQGSSPNNTHKNPSPVDTWDTWTERLEHAPEEPQELDLLGSSKMNYCVKFYYKLRWEEWDSRMVRPGEKTVVVTQNVTPHHSLYKREKNWCNYTFPITSWSSLRPRRLPKGVFLICGDRAWPGIPSHLQGGPCSLGRLTLLTPDIALLQGWKSQLAPKRRSLNEFDENCDSQISDWSKGKRVTGSLLLPWVAAAEALGELNPLGSWLSKQSSATSIALSSLLEDAETIWYGTLQNRAAVDYLLLTLKQGCQEFEGMCCLNLLSHNESIHQNIRSLQDEIKNIQAESGRDWIDGLGCGLMGWLLFLFEAVLCVTIVFVTMLVVVCLLLAQVCERGFFSKTKRESHGDLRDSY